MFFYENQVLLDKVGLRGVAVEDGSVIGSSGKATVVASGLAGVTVSNSGGAVDREGLLGEVFTTATGPDVLVVPVDLLTTVVISGAYRYFSLYFYLMLWFATYTSMIVDDFQPKQEIFPQHLIIFALLVLLICLPAYQKN